MPANMKYQIDPESLKLLTLIESAETEGERFSSIDRLAESGAPDSARILLDTFKRTVWRTTKFALIRGLGKTKVNRAVEALCHIACATDDLPMAAEAVLALGYTENSVAGEFLASIILKENHPLAREALIAIANNPWFPCDELIRTMLDTAKNGFSPTVLQNAVIAAGLRGQVTLIKKIESIIEAEKDVQGSPLFNTALITIGRIGNAESIQFLEQIDTRFRAFAQQLKMAAIESIRLRLGYSVEDAVSQICSAGNLSSSKQAYQMLRAFSPKSVREAFELLAPEATVEQHTLVRVFSPESEFFDDDALFLVKNEAHMSDSIFAALGRTLYLMNKESALKAFSSDVKVLIRFLGGVYTSKSEKILFDIIEDQKQPSSLRHFAINAYTCQPIMQIDGIELVKKMGKQVTQLIEREQDPELKSRLIRVIGQIGYSGPDAMIYLRSNIKDAHENQPSIYAALTLAGTEEAAKIIAKRLKQIANAPQSASEVMRAIEALSKFSVLEESDAFDQLAPDVINKMQIPLLKILGVINVPKLSHLIESGLESDDFQTRLLAVAASKKYHSKTCSEKLHKLLDHSESCVRGRALDSLAVAGDADDHEELLVWLNHRRNDVSAYSKVFRSVSPNTGEDYSGFLSQLETLISLRLGAMNQTDIMQMAVNLRDNLQVNMMNRDQVISSKHGGSASKNKIMTSKEQHVIDETLKRDIPGYDDFSETIKSVLRSGEVICQHPELFDTRVDKSTVLIQFVKSIDLLLQERLGTVMFLQQGGSFLQSMQSRLVRLDLDGEGAIMQSLVNDLQVSLYFSYDTFPAHKLQLICKSIMSGQLMREQYRVIDGLRAWAILLLLFGRNFKYRNVQIDAILPMANANNEGVVKIAREMNELQEARNRAAHRGTMLEMGNMQEMRRLCASVLNSLNEHLAIRR